MGAGSSSQRTTEEKVRHLEAALRHERESVVMLEASVRHERESAAGLQSKGRAALAGGVCAGLLLGLAVPVLIRRKSAAAALAAERLCAAEYGTKLAEIRRRAAVDLKNTEKFAIESFARDLLKVSDSLEHAEKHAQANAHLSSEGASSSSAEAHTRSLALAQGVSLVQQSLLEAFRKHGIEKQDPLAKQFDPNFHEAVLQASSSDMEPGTISEVLRSGFLVHDRVLRAAQVAVASQREATQRSDAVGEQGETSDPPASGP